MRGERIAVIGPPTKLHLMALVAREHSCENSLHLRGIAMGLYRGWRGGGLCASSQVDILESDDSLAFCPTMYNRVFTWVGTRAKSELRVRLVPLNMLKLSSFSFYWRRFCRLSY